MAPDFLAASADRLNNLSVKELRHAGPGLVDGKDSFH